MSDVLRAIDDDVQEVEIAADGSFKAVQHPTPTEAETETIDDEDPYISDSDTEPIIKAEVVGDRLYAWRSVRLEQRRRAGGDRRLPCGRRPATSLPACCRRQRAVA